MAKEASGGVMMGTEWIVWYAHWFSLEQWVLELSGDEVSAEEVLGVSDGGEVWVWRGEVALAGGWLWGGVGGSWGLR